MRDTRGRASLATAALALVVTGACRGTTPNVAEPDPRRAGCPVSATVRTCDAALAGVGETTYRGDAGRTGRWRPMRGPGERPRLVALPADVPAPTAGAAGDVVFAAANGDLVAAPLGGGPGWRTTVGGAVSPVTLVGGVVYVGGQPSSYGGEPPRPGRLHALDAATGRWLWEVEADGAVTAPAVSGGVVYAVSQGGDVLAVAPDGRTRWRVTLGVAVDAPLAVGEGVVAVVAADGTTVALRATDGAEAWRAAGAGVAPHPPVVSGGAVVTLSGGVVRSYRIADGRLAWSARTGAPGVALTVDERHVYAASGAGLVALDRRAGRVRWRAAPAPCASGPLLNGCALDRADALIGPPVVAAGVVVAQFAETGAVAFGTADGRRRWRVRAVAVPGRDVVAPTARGLVLRAEPRLVLLAP